VDPGANVSWVPEEQPARRAGTELRLARSGDAASPRKAMAVLDTVEEVIR
jgi:hypothetical protein